MKPVYFDNAATTQLREEVIISMRSVMEGNYGNPSSSHSFGRASKALVEQSRKTIASFFNVSASEIIFTSGGTEADNLVLRSAVRDLGIEEIITSKIEHHAVLHTIDALAKEYNVTVKYVKLDLNGSIDLHNLESLLQNTTKKQLVSLMQINNEIGNILDLNTVAEMCETHGALFHTDAVQSVGHYNLDLQEVKIDFLAASAHKFHGPKGVGFAFIRKSTALKPLIFGGEQERGIRAGTESVHNIVGMETALKYAYSNLEKESQYIKNLKQYFIDKIKNTIPEITFNGLSDDINNSAYTLVNVCMPKTLGSASMLQFQLDLKGIACSRGSACQSGSAQVSHVLAEILSDDAIQKPSLRFSFSIYNTKEEVDYVVETLKSFIKA
ncbi:cysteine desulfurase [Seonamhaeicola sp. NFXS20]|uniref:cysteine desulfurase family protein n=1 Tax=Seonamhaeicola sp. NFXS20 TaxID=2816959 RepID=UPI003B8C29A0